MTRESSTAPLPAATGLPCGHLLAAGGTRTCPVCGCPPIVEPVAALTPTRPTTSRVHRELLVRSFADFFQAAWHVIEPSTPLTWGWALQAVCDHLQAVIEDWAKRQQDPTFVQRIRDLLITMPPGTAKSRALVMLVPWAWLRRPELRVLALSSNPRVSSRDSVFARDVIASEWYQGTFRPQWQVREDDDSKGSFANTHGGSRLALGWSAKIIGQRGDLLLVDDPHDPEEVESDPIREGVLERWDSTICHRTNDLASSCRVGICNRVHEYDWASARIAEGWTHLDLPMLYEAERACRTPLGTPDKRSAEGDVIDPKRFPQIELEKLRANTSERRWATLYQGRPAPAGGALIKTEWLRFWRRNDQPDAPTTRPSGCYQGPAQVLPEKLTVVITADLAGGKLTRTGDFNAIVAVARSGPDLFLLETWRERAAFPEVLDAFRGFASRYKGAPIVVEQAASGAPVVATLQRELPGVIAQPPRGDKVTRVESILHYFRALNVHLPQHWAWLDGAIAELTTFPSSRFDDFTDALQIAIAYLASESVSPALASLYGLTGEQWGRAGGAPPGIEAMLRARFGGLG